MKKIFSITILLFSTFSLYCQENFYDKITFVQWDIISQINKKTEIIFLERRPFSIRYHNKKYDSENSLFYSTRVAILSNPKDTITLQNEKNIDNIKFFEPGSGIAPGFNNLYDTIYINNSGNHYLTYENEKDKSVNLLSENNEFHEFEWKIFAANFKNKNLQFNELKLSTLFFVFLNDKNLNKTLDNDELKIVVVKFND